MIPETSRAALRKLVETELSLPSRVFHVGVLLAAGAMTIVVGALWATEPALPVRTQAAFALMCAIGVSWMAFAVWVLTHTRILLAGHRIVAGRMSVAFSGVFAAGALAIGLASGRTAAFAAAAVGVVMLAAAIVLLVRARREFTRLTERRDALARQIEGSAR